MTERDANVNFNVKGADKSRQDIDGIRQAAEGLGAAGRAAVQPLVDAFSNVENASARVTQKISDGRAVTVRDGNLIIQQFTILKQTIEQAFGSIAAAPAEIQTAFAKAENQFKSTTATIKNLTTATTENKQAIAGNAAQWGGFEQQLLKMVGADGALGKMIIGFIGITAALTEGIQIGTRFAEAIGTNFEAAKAASASLKTAIGSVTNALVSDGLVAAVQQGSAVIGTMGNTLTGSGKQLEGFNLLVNAGVDRTKALTVSTEDLVAISYAHDIAVKGGVASLQLFNDTLRNSDPADYAKKLDALKGTFDELAKAAKAHVKVLGDLKLEYDAQIKTIDGLIQKHDADLIKMGLVISAIGTEDAARQKLHATVTGEIDDAAKMDIAVKGTTPSIQEVAKNIAGLTADYDANRAMIDKEISRLGALGTSTIGISEETKKHIQTTEDSSAAIKNLEGQNRTLQADLDNSVKAFDRLTPAEVTDRLSKQELIDKNIGLIAQQRDHIAAQADELKATTDTTTATAAATTKVGDFTFKIEDLTTKITNFGTAATFKDTVFNLGQVFGTTAGNVAALVAQLRLLEAQYKTAIQATNDMAAAAGRLDTATKKAAGGQQGSVQYGTSGDYGAPPPAESGIG